MGTFLNRLFGGKASRFPGERRVVVIAGVEVGFCWIPAGKFMMGSPKSEEERENGERLHEVALTSSFWLAETQTTQKLWKAVAGNNPSRFKGDLQRPVESVSWNDVADFIRKLNSLNLISGEFRLPTEAQWEYACRAGTTTPFNFGTSLNGDYANCDGRFPYPDGTAKGFYVGATLPVKSYPPNAWGLYDMHGNVLEWCSDWYGACPIGSVTDPTGSSLGSIRVGRGGSWYCYARNCRSAIRGRDGPAFRYYNLGFRLLMTDVQ